MTLQNMNNVNDDLLFELNFLLNEAKNAIKRNSLNHAEWAINKFNEYYNSTEK